MNPVNDWQSLEFLLQQRASAFHPTNKDSETQQMIGLVFAPAHVNQTKEVLWPSLRYWHVRSGDLIDFYWPGYSVVERNVGRNVFRARSNAPRATVSTSMAFRGQDWFREDTYAGESRHFATYSEKVFTDFVDRFHLKLESLSESPRMRHFPPRPNYPSHRYSGGIDLLLMNVSYDRQSERASLDFGSGIFIHLLRLGQVAPDLSIHELFESVCYYAEHQDIEDPTSGFVQNLQMDGDMRSKPALRVAGLALLNAGAAISDVATLFTLT